VCYIILVEIRPSARRHGQAEDDIRWAVEHALVASDVDTNLDVDVAAVLYLGPNTHGDLLEVVVIEDDAGEEIVIHAMKMRRQYRRLLPGGEP
jgi:hypothetical protein